MVALKPETVLPTLAIQTWKHRALITAQAAIVRLALARAYVNPGDIPEEVVTEPDRQGVASNAWNMLRAAEVINRVPIATTIPSLGIVGGRVRNQNPHAKGRWCAVYTLASRPLAEAWLRANGEAVPVRPAPPIQQEMII